MRKLKVDLGELETAFDNAFPERRYFLDLETGKVVLITDDTNRELEDLYAELPEDANTAEAIQQREMQDWEKEDLLLADQVETGYGTRYIRVESLDPHAGYRDMEDFIATVQDQRLRDYLRRAISGRGAFRHFKDVLDENWHERERWFEFKDAQVRQRVLDWLAGEGIEPIIEPLSPPPSSTPTPPARTRLIAEVLTFVRAARRVPGVTRIALIGSLTTDEPEPKDADLLVTVTDDADLAPLATLGRKLQGHAQGFNRGGEVFLADPQDNYLGRTCPWKQCAPGIRMRCDALHCGRRHYLHDDLETIRLAKELIAAPPIVLWPQIIAHVPIPADVEQGLILPLKEL
ncbi:MAG: hypothetical protein HZB51_06310 [Chloroflexi bacterium]|nr:hypothetical protein [Chloroflexota bacterium]